MGGGGSFSHPEGRRGGGGAQNIKFWGRPFKALLRRELII